MLMYDTVQKIGHLLGFPYTKFNGRCDLPNDPSDGIVCMSGSAELVNTNKNMPPLLIFTGLVSGFQYNIGDNGLNKTNKSHSVYVLNLKTLKPTKNSFRQTELPPELKTIITMELTNHS